MAKIKRGKVKGEGIKGRKIAAASRVSLYRFPFTFTRPFSPAHGRRQSCTVQPRGGVPQPEPTYSPSSTMHGTVGSPSE
jgi:hypothetical protein